MNIDLSTNLRGLRVAIVQPVLPRYRVPFFDLLARRTGMKLTILCDMAPSGSLTSAMPAPTFSAEHHRARSAGPFMSHPAFLTAATSSRFDIAVLGWNMRIVELVPALVAGKAIGKPIMLWGHGFSKSEHPAKVRARDSLVSLSAGVIVYGGRTKERLIVSGIADNKVHLAQNAIDQSEITAATARWTTDPYRLAAWQRLHNITPGELTIFISRIEPDKRTDLLVEAFARIADRRPAARLAIIGGGSDLQRLVAQIDSLGLTDRVHLTGPLYDEDAIAPWCLSAGCFAYPEAIGLSIYHAFGYGLPVVTSDNLESHNPEIESLRPGENGLFYRHRDSEDFADCVETVLSDSATRARWRERAIETVRGVGGFNLETMTEGYARALSAAANSPQLY